MVSGGGLGQKRLHQKWWTGGLVFDLVTPAKIGAPRRKRIAQARQGGHIPWQRVGEPRIGEVTLSSGGDLTRAPDPPGMGKSRPHRPASLLLASGPTFFYGNERQGQNVLGSRWRRLRKRMADSRANRFLQRVVSMALASRSAIPIFLGFQPSARMSSQR
jgi:hypothetical protein